MSEALIPKHGGYRNLKTFQVARLVYDVTVRFCDRQRRLPLWSRDDARRDALVARRPSDADAVARWAKSVHSETCSYQEAAANGALTLIAVASALLGRQVAAQAAAFEREGGFTERLYRVRSERRKEAGTTARRR